jgi:hypothetical protein
VWSLVSGVGVFFMGCGLSVYHGVASLWHPAEINNANVPIALGILAVNLALECYSMQVAYKEIKREAAKSDMTVRVGAVGANEWPCTLFVPMKVHLFRPVVTGIHTVLVTHRRPIAAGPAPTTLHSPRSDQSIVLYCTAQEYIKRAPDPMNIGVFLEDAAALTGIGLAALGMGLASYTHSPVFDAAGMALAGHHAHAHRPPTATSAGGSDRKLLARMAAMNRRLCPLRCLEHWLPYACILARMLSARDHRGGDDAGRAGGVPCQAQHRDIDVQERPGRQDEGALAGVYLLALRNPISWTHFLMQQVVEYLMRDPSVLSVHDVKTIMIGPDIARFKAEIHYNPNTIANKYFNAHNNLPEVWRMLPRTTRMQLFRNSSRFVLTLQITNAIRSAKTDQELQEILVRYSSHFYSTLAAEVARLEGEIRRTFPEFKFLGLEVL